jgi:hypothetical protein
MPRATCRCGEILSVPADGAERIVCPKCSARIRVRRAGSGSPQGPGNTDGFIRFGCPCGRRLKVRVEPDKPVPESGKCPDCGRVVPVPAATVTGVKPSSSSGNLPTGHPEAITEELSTDDLVALEQWKKRRRAEAPRPADLEGPETTATIPVTPKPPSQRVKVEAGLRVCPRCGKPVHLNSIVCRECGAHVPKR